MIESRNPALERFMAAVDGLEKEDDPPPSVASMVGRVRVERGHMIVLGNVPQEAIGLLFGRQPGAEA